MPKSRDITLKAAVLEALFEEMHRDPAVFIMGEDIGAAGGVFKQTEGLFETFGPQRVADTPISEAAVFGVAVGAAMTGMRPIVEVMFCDFMTLIMDQLVNQAAKVHYMSGGGFSVPLTLLTTIGIGGSLGPQHSQSLHAWIAHVPGLKVVMPSTPYDAKGLFKAAVRDNNPVAFFIDRTHYNLKGGVPEGDYIIPLGRADVKREGRDLTIIALSRMVHLALEASVALEDDGISVEVIDPRSLVPLDVDTLVQSVRKTSRVLIMDGGYQRFGVTGELAAVIGEKAFDYLDAPVLRIGAPNVPIPFSRSLEQLVVPDKKQVIGMVHEMFGLSHK
jgi:pyruvate dehydrogenase E1 component beta subunit